MGTSTVDRKVLVVEDDVILSGAYRLKLEDAGFQVIGAKNGKEGLEQVKAFMPDVIILDLMMPLIDGFTFISTLKESDDTKNIPIIVATNLSQDDAAKRALELGAAKCVSKNDLTMEELVDIISNAR